MYRKYNNSDALIIAVFVMACIFLISCSKKTPPTEEIYKTKVLKGTWGWDIDSDAEEPREYRDLWWEHVNEHERYLVPRNGSGLAVVKGKKLEDINLGDLKKMEFTGGRISASDENPDIDVGTILAVRTTEGNLVKLEVTGFDQLNDSHLKYDMRMRYVLYEINNSDSAIAEPQQDSLKIISIEPKSPAILALGEKLTVDVQYNLSSVEQAHIFVRPYTGGNKTRGYRAHSSPLYNVGSGIIQGWFFFDKPTKVDEVLVRMVPDDSREPVVVTRLKINAEWK